MATQDERVMHSEQVAPGMLPKVLNSFDMVVIFVAIVLFIVQASVIQTAGPAGFVYWILGFLLFLIPGALVTAQLGNMFPEEGSLYVWTHKALGSFWGFFAGFCAWFPGVLVMVATGVLVVTLSQSINPSVFGAPWEQGLVILAVIWFSAVLSLMHFRLTQNYVNFQFFFYAAAIFVIGLSGIIWLAKGNPAANSFALEHWKLTSGNWTFFGFVILALLGIEVPLNMGVEIKDSRSIKKYLFWGSIVVMAAYLWTTFGNMVVIPIKDNNTTTGVVQSVQTAIAHPLGDIVALILIWFFVSNTVVYNYSFARLLFVSGLERRLPAAMSHVHPRTKVPDTAVIVQSVLASLFTVGIFMRPSSTDLANKAYLALQAAVTVIWCISMVLLFLDIFFVRRWYPRKFQEVRTTSAPLLSASGIVGAAASIVGAVVVFYSPWGPQFTTGEWRLWVGGLTAVSALVAAAIFVVSERARRGVRATPVPQMPAGGGS
jgi:glutamate:GABA antiporter